MEKGKDFLSQDELDKVLTAFLPSQKVDMTNEAKALAQAHWAFMRGVFQVCLPEDCYSKSHVIEMIGHNYVEAMIHGWKHRAELCGGGCKHDS